MAPVAVPEQPSLPPESPLQTLLKAPLTTTTSASSLLQHSPHPPHLLHLARQILFNLHHEHYWTQLRIHTSTATTTQSELPVPQPLARPLISGLPPKRLYVHPDEQIELIKAEHALAAGGNGSNGSNGARKIDIKPELEWVLPTHIEENFSLERFAEMFDGVGSVPPSAAGDREGLEGEEEEDDEEVGAKWRGKNRQKRILLATLCDDSTVVYYIMHDGIVKPRQN